MTTSTNLPALPIGQDGYPIPGIVIQFYRKRMCYTTQEDKQKRWTQDDLARQLQISKAMVRKMETNNQGLDSMERRRLLANLLNIPPILLGLGTIEQLQNAMGNTLPLETPNIASRALHVGPEEILLYKDTLPLFQSAYDQQALQASTLENWIQRITGNIEHLHDKDKNDILPLLVPYHVLASKVYGHDKTLMNKAYNHLDIATQFAVMLNNAELLAFIHHYRGELLVLENKLLLAKNEMDYALNLTKNSDRQACGRTLTITALTYSMIEPDHSQKLYIHQLLDEAEKYATNGGSMELITFNPGIYYMDKADTLITLGLYKQADRALDEAEDCLQYIKREKAYIDILRAECYIKWKRPEYEAAVVLLGNVLQGNTIANYHTNYVARLHKIIAEGSYGKAPDAVELGQRLRILQAKK